MPSKDDQPTLRVTLVTGRSKEGVMMEYTNFFKKKDKSDKWMGV